MAKIAPNNKVNNIILSIKDNLAESINGLQEVEKYYKDHPEKLTEHAAGELAILSRLRSNLIDVNEEIRLHR